MELPIRLQDVTKAQLRDVQSKDFARWLQCLAIVRAPNAASELFLERYPSSMSASLLKKSLDTLEIKAAVTPGSTTGTDWAKPVVGVTNLVTGFAAIAHSRTIIGRIDNMVLVPFNTKIPTETQGGNFVWTREGAGKPVTKISLTDGVVLDMLKATGIVVLSNELVKSMEPGAADALRATLINALVAFQDLSFLSPTSTAIPGQRPASITAGLTPVASTGNLPVDVQTLLNTFFTARPGAQEPTLIAGGAKAAQLRALNPGFGLPILSTEAAANNVIVVDGSGVYYGDGGLQVDVANNATLVMDSAPPSPETAASTLTSLFQDDLTGFRFERRLNWTATPTSVAYLAA